VFAESYEIDAAIGSTAVGAGVSVDSSDDGVNVVAPGTDGSIDFSISGTPEVAVAVTFAVNVTEDVIIPSGTEIAEGNTLAAAYTPVVFTLEDSEGTEIGTGTLTDIKDALVALTAAYPPNTPLDETYTLSWEWAFDGNDEADTYLGNVAAGKITDADTKTGIDFDFTITVDQIN